MAYINQEQRRRWMRNNADLYIRQDAERFFLPGRCPEELKPRHRKDSVDRSLRQPAEDPELSLSPQEVEAIENERLVIRRELASLRLELALLRFKYNANQPRVPAGNPDGGQWTDGGAFSDLPARMRLAGMPKIPRQRPPNSRDRTATAKAVAIWAMEKGLAAAEIVAKSSWLYPAVPYISSYLDAPKSLGELHEDALTPKLGYDRHHIVEQSSAEADNYPRSRIDGPDNLVRIPRMKHWDINAWYETASPDYGDVSPRVYLRGKDWEERRRVGLEALRKAGVLKP